MENNQPIYTPEQIMARVHAIEKVLQSWKGNAEYATLIEMEIWALTAAAQLLQSSRQIIMVKALEKGIDLPVEDRNRMAMQACERIAEIL